MQIDDAFSSTKSKRSIFKQRRSFHKRGLLIAGEGLDGSGKTTVIEALLERLNVQGKNCTLSNWNEVTEVYNLMMHLNMSGDLTPSMRLVFGAAELASRYHYVILPALNEGKIVFVNKYLISAIAHSVIRGQDRNFVSRVYQFALQPDLTLYFDIPPEVALRRKLQSGGIGFWEAGLDLVIDAPLEEVLFQYENGKMNQAMLSSYFIDFQQRLHYVHQEELKNYNCVLRLDASQSLDAVLQETTKAIGQLISPL